MCCTKLAIAWKEQGVQKCSLSIFHHTPTLTQHHLILPGWNNMRVYRVICPVFSGIATYIGKKKKRATRKLNYKLFITNIKTKCCNMDIIFNSAHKSSLYVKLPHYTVTGSAVLPPSGERCSLQFPAIHDGLIYTHKYSFHSDQRPLLSSFK